MKKLFVLVLTLTLCLSFAGCKSPLDAVAGEIIGPGSIKDDVADAPTYGGETVAGGETTAPVKNVPKLDAERSGSLGKNITWVLSTDGVLAIKGTGNMQSFKYDDGAVDTPWFDVRECIVKAVVEEGVNSISAHTFYKCTNMETAIIPSTVDEIGSVAFCDCKSLKEITIPEGVDRLGNTTFSGCAALTKINLPESLTSIAQSCFAGSGITELKIPNAVNFLGRDLASHCTKMKSLTLPASLDEVPEYGFSNCTGLEKVVIPEGIEEIGKKAFVKCTNLTEIQIPASVTAIGEDAFKDCENLTIVGVAGSAAETYAKANNIPFKTK